MSEEYECPNCEEDCIKIAFLDEKMKEGLSMYRFECPHCKCNLVADLEMIPTWWITEQP